MSVRANREKFADRLLGYGHLEFAGGRGPARTEAGVITASAGTGARIASMPPDFRIQESSDADEVRLQLSGELDLVTAPILERRLAQLRAEGQQVRLDFSRLDFMDSSGIHVLVDALNHAREDGLRLEIEPAVSAQVRRLLTLTGLERVISAPASTPPIAVMNERQASPARRGSAFDQSLELGDLRRAAEQYASRHGEPGSADYRAAWLKFRQRIKTVEDLNRWRESTARRSSARAKARPSKQAEPSK